MGLVAQAQTGQQLIDPSVVTAHAKVTRLETQGLAHVKKRIKHQLLWHHPDLAAGLCIVNLHIAAQHRYPARSGFGQAGQNGDQGGFARAVGAKQAKKLSRLNVQTDLVQCQKPLALGFGGCRIGFADRLEGDGGHGAAILGAAL